MSEPITGGCRCGNVKYEITAEPIVAGNCHCRDCQHVTGSTHFPGIGFPADALNITGEPNTYSVATDSGNTSTRVFCPTCGDLIGGYSTGMAGMKIIAAVSLDDPSIFKPGMDVFTESAQPWDVMDPELPKFPGMPDMPDM